ncbi:glycosyltransferase family 4 protein [Hydrogenophaga sp. BPS33]|uniref:glycosyltransferase family 4 protein n=1 Tax=Hydrogenophaga sp. BPS33 TaxID=2651974 RepID=UPI00131F51E4|nr:glycosyltransferase family 4 protein [Hydrogenophaga sp. BPS33]QHE86178.1 glycosyltransferase family 4 protein [Hydrogenophaga sp. BPS33]
MAERACHVLIPGDWNTPTGGYTYDRRLVLALREAGWTVDVHTLEGCWPRAEAADLAHAAGRIAALPDGALVVADGLAFGGLAQQVQPHAQRLRWVALVHHPLHLETGLDAHERSRLQARESQALQLARHVVVTSRSTVDDVAAMGVRLDRIAVVEPGTDAVSPSHAPRHEGGPVQLLCVATLTPRKGHAVLLEALAGLVHLPWVLHLVGSTARAPGTAARVQAQAAPLGERVVWHGELPAAALHAHYAAADVFVLPSLYEGYGMVVAEAIAHGLVVVCTDGGALAHTLPRAAGLLVPAGDALSLQAALARVITDAGLRAHLAEGARAAARQLPTWPQQAARFAAVLEGVA